MSVLPKYNSLPRIIDFTQEACDVSIYGSDRLIASGKSQSSGTRSTTHLGTSAEARWEIRTTVQTDISASPFPISKLHIHFCTDLYRGSIPPYSDTGLKVTSKPPQVAFLSTSINHHSRPHSRPHSTRKRHISIQQLKIE